MLKTLQQISTPVAGERPGDILLVSHRHGDRKYLDHVVLVIDRNLYFEKAGTGDEVPYRFVDAGTLQQIWNPTIFHYELRRPLQDRHLPVPSDRFSLKQWPEFGLPLPAWEKWRAHLSVVEEPDAPPTFLWMQSLPPLQNVRGRFQLPPAAYQSHTLGSRYP
jgi:hypothetical protein